MSDASRVSAGVFGVWGTLLVLLGYLGLQQWNASPTSADRAEHLAPCTADGSAFAQLPFAQWPQYFHDTVDDIVSEHLLRLQEPLSSPLRCTESNTSQKEDPSSELESLARSLPPWKPSSGISSLLGPAEPPALSESDIGPVLMEFLRIYICSWAEASLEQQEQANEPGASFVRRAGIEMQQFTEESAAARNAIERTLIVLGGVDRLDPLVRELTCLERASLDLRNALGLVSDASACLPRAWDARGILRDVPTSKP